MSPHVKIANMKLMHLDMIPMEEFGELQPKHGILKLGQVHSSPLGCSSLGFLTVFVVVVVVVVVFPRNRRFFSLSSLRGQLKRMSSNEF